MYWFYSSRSEHTLTTTFWYLDDNDLGGGQNIGMFEKQLALHDRDVMSYVTAGNGANCANLFAQPIGTLAVVFCMLFFLMC
jgi:hypothetical protein